MTRWLLLLFIGVICFVIVSGNFDVRVFYKPSIVGISNKSAKIGMILDYSSPLIMILNGKRFSIIVIDISKQEKYYLQLYNGDEEGSFWSHPEHYFRNTSDVQQFLKVAQEQVKKSKLDSLEGEVRGDLEEAFHNLGGFLSIEEELSRLTYLIDKLRGPPTAINSGSGSFMVVSGVDSFTKVELAEAEMLSGSNGNSVVQVFYKPFLIGLSNKSAKMGVVINFASRVIIVINGKRSSIIAVDISRQLIYYLRLYNGDADSRIWSNPENYFQRPSDVHEFLEMGEKLGKISRLYNLEGSVREAFEEVLHSLGSSLSIVEVISLLTNLIDHLRDNPTALNGRSGSFMVSRGADAFTKMELAEMKILSGSNGNSDVQVFYGPSFVGISNKSAKMDAIIDYHSQVMMFLNGERSSVTVVDVSEQVTYYLQLDNGDADNSIWSDSEYYFKESSDVQVFLNLSKEQGKKSKLDTSKEPVRGNFQEVFHSLGGSSSIEEEFSLLTNFIDKLRGPSTATNSGNGSSVIASEVNLFTKVKLAVAELLSSSNGNSDVQVFYKPSLIGISNKSTKMGVIIDYSSSQLILVLNGNRYSVIVVDVSEQVTYYLQLYNIDAKRSIWSDSEYFFQRPSDVQWLLELAQKQGKKYRLDYLEKPVREDFEEVCHSLKRSSLEEVVSLLTDLIHKLRGPPTAINSGSGSFMIARGVDAFTKMKLAVKELLSGSNGNSDVKLFYNPSVIGISNKSTKMGVIIDYFSRLMMVLNEKRSSVIMVDISKKVIYHLQLHHGNKRKGFLSEPEYYFQKPSDIQFFLNYSKEQGKKSKLDTSKEPVRGNFQEVFHSLGGSSSIEKEFSLLTNFIDKLKGPPAAVNSGNGSFRITRGVDAFTKMELVVTEMLVDSNGNSDVKLFYNPSVIGISNKSTKMGVVIEFSSRLIMILNGKRSSVIMVVISEEETYYLQLDHGDADNSIWSNSEYHFQEPSDVQKFLKVGKEQGKQSKLDTLKEPVRENCEEVFHSLGGSLSVEEELSLLTNLIDMFRSPHTAFYSGSGSFMIARGVDAFTIII